ncbi:MAG: ATP-dependent DNA helicase UvrD2 [Acidimicrobiia bacterium]|nr:ATP-dependent DNA helicase UvrD2 [Acidimicrobiia bacterium]
MTAPGPTRLGRSVVIDAGAEPPAAWADCERIIIDTALLGNRERLESVVARAQRRYVRRTPTVFELAVPQDVLSSAPTIDAAPFELGADFTFLSERLAKCVWHNSYDARRDPPVWWWAHKAAARIGVQVGGSADVITKDGTEIWIDGGPREPLDVPYVVHHESVDLGNLRYVPSESTPDDDLAPDQLEAVSHRAGPARIIAPAGSGKTRVLTSRLRHLIEDRDIERATITAVAYNRQAAEEMIERVPEGHRLQIRTIHGLGWAILRSAKPHLALIGEREQRRRLEPLATAPPRPNTDVIGPYLEALGEVRIGLIDPVDVEASRDDVPGFADTFRRYRDVLDRNGEADHDEQIYGAIEVLCADADLRAHWQRQCRHLLVDEFQDLTPAYMLLLRLLASPGLEVFGVGDDDQVIYGYAGADPHFLLDFERLFPGAGSHALTINYRCPADVVSAATSLLAYNRRRVDKDIHPADDAIDEGLTVVQAEGSKLGDRALVRIRGILEDGAHPSSIAVLARVNSSLLPVHVSLAEAGIPFQSQLSASVLDRTLIRAALAWMRVALAPDAMSRNDLFEIVRRPQRGITRLLSDSIGRRLGPFHVDELVTMGRSLDGRRRTNWDGFCDDILLAAGHTSDTPGLLEVLESRVGLGRAASALDAGRTRADRSAQADDLAALLRVAAMQPDPTRFEPWLRERLGTVSQPGGIVLSSVHRVKGLEWDHVLVFGADRGTMPHDLSNDPEEERRVFHVAITRGRRSVTVLVDRDRPSRFMTELDGTAPLPADEPARPTSQPARAATPGGVYATIGDVITVTGGYTGAVDEILTTGVLIKLESTGATMAVPWGEPVTKGGNKGRLTPGAGPADPDLVDRLKRWRLAQATAQGVPAYVIFNDATLEALAGRRPSSGSELLEIPGIGPAKLEAYGEDLLDLLAD